MNIVRGVTGLIRRSLVAQESIGSQEEQRRTSDISVAWPEIYFKSDNEDEHVLESLWKCYKDSSRKIESLAEAEAGLTAFLVYFLEVYESWVPTEPFYGENRFPSSEENVVFGCSSGHPTTVVISLIEELKDITRILNGLTDGTKLSQSTLKRIEDLLHVFEILNRSAHNRHNFKKHEGLQIIVNVMKAAVVQLKRVVSTSTMEHSASSSIEGLPEFLQGLLRRVVKIISLFINVEREFTSKESPEGLESYVKSDKGSIEELTRKERVGASGSVPLMEMGGLNWFVELLRVVKVLRTSSMLIDTSLEQLSLMTLKAALVVNVRAQNHFRSLGGIDVLVNGIGCPQKEMYSSEDFQTQVLALEALREAVFRNLSGLQYVLENGGVDKFVELIIWAAFIFPKLNLKGQDADGDNLQGWNSRVSKLCTVLCSFLVESGDIRGFIAGLACSHDALSAPGSYWELATRWILKVLLGSFRNLKPTQITRPCSTTLQHYVLYVFKKMFAASLGILSLFHEEGLWDVMFSEHFFYFEMSSNISIDGRRLSDAQVLYSSGIFDHGDHEEIIDSEPLRLEVISFVELAATANSSYDNAPECHALMVALEQCARIPSVSTTIVKSLHRILQLAPEQTVRAFEKLKALELLSQVMDIQLQEYNKIRSETTYFDSIEKDDGSSKHFTPKETWLLSRESVFNLFAEYVLTSEEARIVSLHSVKSLQVLFDLLWDLESREFALGHILDVMKLPPTSEADQGAKLELCIKYLETLSRSSVDGKPRDIDVLLDLLSGIRHVLETDTVYYQSLFQEAECFVHIVSLLNENLSEENGKILCLSVIQTLRCLLAGNKSSKDAFRSLVGVGYTTLQTLLLNSHLGSPTEGLLSALLDMLVDGEFKAADNILIQNEDIIIVFFSILRKCGETLQLFGLITFNRILESTANKAAGAKAGLLSLLLDWFGSEYNDNLIVKLAILIETLGRHSITGKDMRKIFSLLRNANTGSKPMHRKILLKVVQGILSEEGPAAFFDLSGKNSGIIITSNLRWPSLRGFTFSCWMRMETFPTVENVENDTMLMDLFTFLTDSGKGYSTMISPEKLVVEAFAQKKQSIVLNLHMAPKHWYHLSVTHSVGRTLSGGGTLRVYVDGCLASNSKLRYPKFSEPLSKCSIGGVSPLLTSEGFIDKGKFSLPFCGQLGPIYFFDDSLSSNQIMEIFQAGPGYMYSFLPTEVGCLPENIASNSIFDMKDGLSSKLIFGFNAQASSGCTIYNVAFNSDGTAEGMSHEAVITSRNQLCYRHLVKDIIDCVGGLGVFFPLLTQLDQPVTSVIVSHETEVLDNAENMNTFNVYDAAEVIDLITSVLSDNSAHQQYMHQNKGISIIGFLLQSVSPQHLTSTVANSLVHLLSVVSKKTGGFFSNQLVEEVLVKVFLNLNIWIYTPYTVQRELLMALLNFCESDAGLARSHITLPRILDLVQQFYWVRSSRKVSGTKRLLHPVTKQVIGIRPSLEEVGKLRILLLSSAEMVVRDNISLSDVKAILAFLERSEDPVCLEDVLHMLLRLLSRKEFAEVFVEDIQVFGGCQLFLSLLEREEETLRVLGLQIIGLLLISTPEKKGSWLLTIATGVTRSLYDSNRAERTKLIPLFSAIMERLIVFPFSDLVCASLFDMLLGGASLKQVLQRSSGAMPDASLTSTQFALPQVLGILMKFLLVCDDKETCCTVLRDLLRLLEANPSRIDAIVLEPFWQCWLFDLLVHIQDVKIYANKQEVSLSMLEQEEMLIYDIFAIIHLYCTYYVKGGWRHVERTINAAHLYADKGSFSKFNLLHRILGDLLEALLQARSQETGQMPQPCRDNVLYVLTLMDELFIKDTIQFLPFSEERVRGDDAEALQSPSSDRYLNNTQQSINRELRLKPDNVSIIEEQYWQVYTRFWAVLEDVYGKDRDDFSVPSLGQRARGLVESMNIPAAEMAAAVVAGGFGAVVNMNPGKLIDKAVKLRGEKFPRVVCHLALLYLYRASLEAASSFVNQFVSLLPLFLASESEQCKNRLQLFLWCLLEARTQLALADDGARFHLISHFIREIVDHGKNMLSVSMTEQDEGLNDTPSVQSLLQQDRITHALNEEREFLESSVVERSNEVHSLDAELKDAEEYGKSNLKFLEEQRQSNLSILCANDSKRMAAVQLAYEEDQQSVANHWCHMFRHLTDERGPWSTLPFPNDIQILWKLDKTEDPWRRRPKMKRNYSLNGHLILTPEGSDNASMSVPVAKVTSLDTLLETSKVLLKGLRGISEEEIIDTSDEEKSSLVEHKSINEQESETVNSSLEENDMEHEDTVSLSPEKNIKKPDDEGLDKVLHSTVCVLVTPKRKLAGRFEITEDSLHFYGDFLVEGTAGSSVFTSSGQLNCSEHVALDVLERAGKSRADSREGNDYVHFMSDKVNIQDSFDFPQHLDHLQGWQKGIKRHRRWDLLKVKAVHGTRYLLQCTALEIFFDNSMPPVFLNFPFQRNAKEVGLKIISLRNGFVLKKGSSREKMEFRYFVDKRFSLELAERYRDQWRRREISNFEYLMYLNTLAGRSYNDLTQYPVFPWVISDYTSETLDLNAPSSFRDLSKPVGALDAKRFEVFEERFQNFSDPDIPSFYYGSHYSSMGIVLFYLLRLEPFTSLHRNLQGGKFDHADRLFHSIEGTYRNCLANTSDVKELIPEFFYMPEFLVNSNKYHMGVKQDGERLDNVALPPWAKGSPEKFISKNREALECEYVSQHLHEWIDLIFGYKQRGRPAVEAANVFYHLTYEGAVELESLDRLQRAAVEDQIANFGQTPIQLFRKKHPRRGAPMPISRPLYYAPASITLTSSVPASMLIPSAGDKAISLLFVGLVDGKVVIITNDLKIIVRNWVTASQAGGNFTFSSSQELFYGVGTEVSQAHRIKGPFSESVELNSSFFQVLQVRASSYVLTCGHWDNSFRVTCLSDGSLVQINRQHRDVVSCLAVSSDGTIVVTGSYDTTVIVWEMDISPILSRKAGSKDIGVNAEKSGKWESIVCDSPRHVLSGHDDAITCVAVSVELDLILSGSKDCSCIIHSLRQGRYVRSIRHPMGNYISKLVVSKHGRLVLFSNDDLTFLLYSVNGKHLASSESNGRINCLEVSSCGEFLLCGGDQSQVILRSIYTLDVIRKYDTTNVPILSLSITPEDCFLVGMQDGSLLIYSIERQQQKKSSSILQTLRVRNT